MNRLNILGKFDSEEMNQFTKIIGSKEDVSSDFHHVEQQSKSETEKKIKMMLSRIAFMVEKARTANHEVKKIKLKKDECRNKIIETSTTKTQSEIDLRIQQCEALELKMSLMAFPETDNVDLASVEERIKTFECDVEKMDFELHALRKEEAELSEDMEDAERSYCGIMEVVNAMQFEFKMFKS